MLLTACAQAPNYAPVMTVNQAFEPYNGDGGGYGYGSEKSPTKLGHKPDIIQHSVEILDKEDELNQTRQNPVSNGTPYPERYQPKPSPTHSTDRAVKKEAVNVPITSGQKVVNQNQRTQRLNPSPNKAEKLTKNKSPNPAVEKSQYSKPHNLAKSGHQPIGYSRNKSILSSVNAIDTQKNQESDANSLDNLKLTENNNKKSSISIDNKKMLKLNFQWPLHGRVSRNFSQTDNKGILIKGKTGQSVYAAEAGKTVYCGQGLAGFGNLAIIKHNETYLSAYAINSKLTIKEGQQVKRGQTIGEVGLTGLRRSSLHFEIRKNGEPINPLTVLPKL
jgi:lipoprotein NlpD